MWQQLLKEFHPLVRLWVLMAIPHRVPQVMKGPEDLVNASSELVLNQKVSFNHIHVSVGSQDPWGMFTGHQHSLWTMNGLRNIKMGRLIRNLLPFSIHAADFGNLVRNQGLDRHSSRSLQVTKARSHVRTSPCSFGWITAAPDEQFFKGLEVSMKWGQNDLTTLCIGGVPWQGGWCIRQSGGTELPHGRETFGKTWCMSDTCPQRSTPRGMIRYDLGGWSQMNIALQPAKLPTPFGMDKVFPMESHWDFTGPGAFQRCVCMSANRRGGSATSATLRWQQPCLYLTFECTIGSLFKWLEQRLKTLLRWGIRARQIRGQSGHLRPINGQRTAPHWDGFLLGREVELTIH